MMTQVAFRDKLVWEMGGQGELRGKQARLGDEKRAEPLVKGRESFHKNVSHCERMPEVRKEYIANDPLKSPTFEALRKYVQERRSTPVGQGSSFEDHERELHRLVSSCEAELLAEDLARHDVNEKYVEVEGVRYRKALRAEKTYVGQAGPMRVERNLYQPVGGGPSVCPMEFRAGIVEGAWTPRAARIMAYIVSDMPPTDAERMIREFGGMSPSASSLDRLPKLLSERWEERRLPWEEALRAQDRVPEDAVTIAVSLDGVHVPLKKKELQDDPKNKNGYREASCGTVSYLDKDGKRLWTIRFARMPETKKRTLKSQLEDEFEWAMAQRPDLQVVKIADGASDNWTFLQALGEEEGIEILDFYHAATHLKDAADATHGVDAAEAKALFESWKTTLKEDPEGATKVIRAVRYRRDQAEGSARKILTAALKYFRAMQDGMEYHAYMEACLPIGSGVVEAACKTLVSERLKQSGMRWTLRGGQAILTLRSVLQSARWESAWAVLAGSYRADVRIPRQPAKLKAA